MTERAEGNAQPAQSALEAARAALGLATELLSRRAGQGLELLVEAAFTALADERDAAIEAGLSAGRSP